MAPMDSTQSGTTHQSQLNLASDLLTMHHICNCRTHGGQSCRNRDWIADDFNIDTSLFDIYILGEQAAMVR